MGIGPISYSEIEAYLRLTLDDLTAWEVRLIRRIDNAVRGVVAAQAPKPKDTKPGPTVETFDVSDTHGMRQSFRAVAAARAKKS